MRSLIAILALAGLLHAQDYWVRWNGEWTTPDQREFAEKCYEIGFNYGDRGHTAVCLGWTESGLGADTTHNEDSYKHFGLSEIALLDIGCEAETFDSLKAGLLTLERETFLALDYRTLCYERLLGAGLSPAEASFWSYPKYSTGSNYLRFRRRGEVFQMRFRFLMNVVFPPDGD